MLLFENNSLNVWKKSRIKPCQTIYSNWEIEKHLREISVAKDLLKLFPFLDFVTIMEITILFFEFFSFVSIWIIFFFSL